ncbi:MAG: putative membrane protein [Halobacteriales archaeon]|jgi:uncharacterized membrane protein
MTASGETSDYDGVQEFLRESVVTGIAIILPLLVTVLVLRFFVNFVSQILEPVVQLVSVATGTGGLSNPVLELITFLTLATAILFVGAISESGSVDVGGVATVETLIARIPGIGSLYQGVDEMSQVLLDNDTDSFQEVKLVEFPTEGSFSLAFLTTETPEVIEYPLDHEEMVTVYLPLAPNPVMGGYVLHVAAKHVYDVDMTVEEGIQSIVTSGVATGHHSGDALSDDMMDRINRRFNRMDIVPRVESVEEYAQVAYEKLGPTHSESTDISETSEESGDSDPGNR